MKNVEFGVNPKISINAINGSRNPCTIRVQGSTRTPGVQVAFLLDAESTHNFISSKMTQNMNLKSDKEGNFEVVVAYRDDIKS